jgi:hypothetical protein
MYILMLGMITSNHFLMLMLLGGPDMDSRVMHMHIR